MSFIATNNQLNNIVGSNPSLETDKKTHIVISQSKALKTHSLQPFSSPNEKTELLERERQVHKIKSLETVTSSNPEGSTMLISG